MKKLFLLLLFSSAVIAMAQDKKNVEGAASVNEIVDTETQYLLPEFVDGMVMYKSGEPSRGKLNYNILLNEVQFINPANGEVLAVNNQSNINVVTFGKRSIVKSPKGFVETVYKKGDTELVVRRNVKATEKSGASLGYGTRTNTGSTEKASTMGLGIGMEGLQQTHSFNVAPDEIKVQKSHEFYLVKADKYYAANKKGFVKAYSSKKNEVESYIDEQKIDFKNENDLKKLIDYCNSL